VCGETLTAVDQIAAAIVVLSQSTVLCNRTWHPVALGVSDRAAILAAHFLNQPLFGNPSLAQIGLKLLGAELAVDLE